MASRVQQRLVENMEQSLIQELAIWLPSYGSMLLKFRQSPCVPPFRGSSQTGTIVQGCPLHNAVAKLLLNLPMDFTKTHGKSNPIL
jgi:hypothetical protein